MRRDRATRFAGAGAIVSRPRRFISPPNIIPPADGSAISTLGRRLRQTKRDEQVKGHE